MIVLNPKDYPLSQTRDIDNVYKYFRAALEKEQDTIQETDEEKHMIHFFRIDSPGMFFKVFNPGMYPDFTPYYHLKCCPEDEFRLSSKTRMVSSEELIRAFREWISLIKQYDAISFSPEQAILKSYEVECYDTFEFQNEEEKDRPFSEPQQKALFYILEGVEKGLNAAATTDPEIIRLAVETRDLKANIQNYTKNMFARKWSKTWAFIKKKSIPLALNVIEEAKKELIKRGIGSGFDGIGHFLSQHHHF